MTKQSIKQLIKLMKETSFSPNITGQQTNSNYTIVAEYHLQFPRRGEVLRPIINLLNSASKMHHKSADSQR